MDHAFKLFIRKSFVMELPIGYRESFQSIAAPIRKLKHLNGWYHEHFLELTTSITYPSIQMYMQEITPHEKDP